MSNGRKVEGRLAGFCRLLLGTCGLRAGLVEGLRCTCLQSGTSLPSGWFVVGWFWLFNLFFPILMALSSQSLAWQGESRAGLPQLAVTVEDVFWTRTLPSVLALLVGSWFLGCFSVEVFCLRS